jgi:hypothetical protein
MTRRFESSAWRLAAGSACVFTLAIVGIGLPWPLIVAALAVAVAAWSCAGPIATGALLGAIAWACATGFDVNTFGDLSVHGSADLLRAAVLVAAGAISAVVRLRMRPTEFTELEVNSVEHH